MSKITDKIYLFGTYMIATMNFVLSFEFIKGLVIFLATMILLIIQIRIHWIRLKKEEDKEQNNTLPKKN